MTPKEAELFIRNMSHEIKNPLTTIKGYAQLLQLKDSDPAFSVKACSMISDQVQRIEDLFNGFYSLFALPESQNSSFNFKSFIDELADQFPSDAGTTVFFNCPSGRIVSSDRDAIRRSVMLIVCGFRWSDFPSSSLTVRVSGSDECVSLSLSFGTSLFSFLDENSFVMPFATGHLFVAGTELFSANYILSRAEIPFMLNAGSDGFTVII
jgi:light-regulated signal transduction histidine kinase (bacteriophytochrome)